MDRGLFLTVLGPVTARRDGAELDLGSPQQRALLAVLLLHEGAQVTAERLAGALWSEVPASAATTVRTYVYRLRRVLGQEAGGPVIRSVAGGYLLQVAPEQHDLGLVRAHLAAAEKAAHPADALAELTAALDRFAGTPLAGLPGPYLERQRTRLEQLRESADEQRLQALIDVGTPQRVVPELVARIAERPLDERLRELYLLALYRSGRPAEALAAFQDARRVLADELGIDPGPGLRALHERILQADPTLAEPVAGAGPAAAPPAGPPVAQLPPDLGAFTGRGAQLDAATALLTGGEQRPGPVIGLVVGTAGVGKTTFAVHWAHRVAGRYPDGQIYLNLRGFDPAGEPIAPADAVLIVLQSLGCRPSSCPPTRRPGTRSIAACSPSAG